MPHVAYGVLGQTNPHIIEVWLFTLELQCSFFCYVCQLLAKVSSERFIFG